MQPLSCRALATPNHVIILAMLKIRIIAALIALAFTALTIYLVPKVMYYYTSLVNGLSHDQQIWLNWAQALIGGAIGLFSFWLWKKKKRDHDQSK
jgi:H+/Cl- antiporter ClcA